VSHQKGKLLSVRKLFVILPTYPTRYGGQKKEVIEARIYIYVPLFTES